MQIRLNHYHWNKWLRDIRMLNNWYVYIIRCSDNSLYTGITTDVSRRLLEHQSQGNKTAKYLRGKSPLNLVFQLEVKNRSSALKIEQKIKQLSKSEKEKIIIQQKIDSTLLVCL